MGISCGEDAVSPQLIVQKYLLVGLSWVTKYLASGCGFRDSKEESVCDKL